MKFKIGDKVKMIQQWDDWITKEVGTVLIVEKETEFCRVSFPDRHWSMPSDHLELEKKMTIKEMNEEYFRQYNDSKQNKKTKGSN